MSLRSSEQARRWAAKFQIARTRMVERELLRVGMTEPRLVAAFLKVPRDCFVHQEAMRLQAYEDAPLPIGLGQTLSAPSTQARMTAALEVGPEHRVLEIGTGSGYQTAILAELAGKVFTIERHEELSRRAMKLLRELGYGRILAHVGDGSMGWPDRAPFDRILVTACSPGSMERLVAQLEPDGILIAPQAGGRSGQRLVRVSRDSRGGLRQEDLGPCQFVPLVGQAGYSEVVDAGAAHGVGLDAPRPARRRNRAGLRLV